MAASSQEKQKEIYLCRIVLASKIEIIKNFTWVQISFQLEIIQVSKQFLNYIKLSNNPRLISTSSQQNQGIDLHKNCFEKTNGFHFLPLV